MAFAVDVKLHMGGLTVKFEDGSEVTGTFIMENGILTMEGLDTAQQDALRAFNQRIDNTALFDPRLASVRCEDLNVAPTEEDVDETGEVFNPTAFATRSVIMAIYDESQQYYTGGKGFPSTPQQALNYNNDLTAWEVLVDNAVASNLEVRMGLMHPFVSGPAGLSPVEDWLRCDTCRWPKDSQRAEIDIESFDSIFAVDINRITQAKIVSFFNTIISGGYAPTLAVFILDNSGSMIVDHNYGGPGQPNLVAAKAQLVAENPGLVILTDEVTLGNEDWLGASKRAYRRILTTGGL